MGLLSRWQLTSTLAHKTIDSLVNMIRSGDVRKRSHNPESKWGGAWPVIIICKHDFRYRTGSEKEKKHKLLID